MDRTRRIYFFFLFIMLIGMATGIKGQETHPTRGFMPNMDQLSSPVDNIDIASGKLHINIPLASMPRGKGGTGYNLNLSYDSHIYDIATTPNPPDGAYASALQNTTSSGGWKYNANNVGIEAEFKEGIDPNANCTGIYAGNVVRYRVILPDGSMHLLYLRGKETLSDRTAYYGYNLDVSAVKNIPLSNACSNAHGFSSQHVGLLTYYTLDGSYLKYEIYVDGINGTHGPGNLYFPDGRRWVLGADSVVEYDANGNFITRQGFCNDDCDDIYTLIADQSGNQITINHNTEYANQGLDEWRRDEVVAPGPNGNVTYTIDWKHINIGPKNALNGLGNYTSVSLSNWEVKYVQMPHPAGQSPSALGSAPSYPEYSYKFGYWDNSGVFEDPAANVNDPGTGWGMLNYMQMPSGARYYYKYGLTGIPTLDEIAFRANINQKTIVADDTQLRWYYTFTWDANNAYTYATDPNGRGTVYTKDGDGFILLIEQKGPNWPSVKAGGTEIRRIWGERDAHEETWTIAPRNPYLQKDIVAKHASNSALTKSAITEFNYDNNGNLQEKKEYEWVPYLTNGYPTLEGSQVKRKTTYDYYVPGIYGLQNNPTAYWNVHDGSLWPAGTARRLNAPQRQTIFEWNTQYNRFDEKAATEYVYKNNNDDAYSTGNVLYARNWDSEKAQTLPSLAGLSSSNSRQTEFDYDTYGNLTYKNESGTQTHITYDSTGSRIMQIDTALGTPEHRSVENTWLNAVALQSKRDVENNLMTVYSYDNLGRSLTVTQKDSTGGNLRKTENVYYDSEKKVKVKNDLKDFGDGLLQSIKHYDKLGRVTRVQQSDGYPLVNDSDGIKVDTYYQIIPNVGSQVVSSSPYRDLSDSILEWSCSQSDRFGLNEAVATFKGSTAPTDCECTTNRTGISRKAYDADSLGNTVTVTDPTGKARKQISNVLGQLVRVLEDPSAQNPYTTIYKYDALDNLTEVNQGNQTRTFSYSSLGRLLTATNPESGTTEYTYYDNGNLQTKTDARGIITTMTYDPLQRLLSKDYSDATPDVTYEYYLSGSPNIGQLESVSSSAATTTYFYNTHGEVSTSTHTINGLTGTPTFNYQYYLNGALKSEQYPSGRLVNYDIDNAGRTNRVYTGALNYANMTGVTTPFTADGRIAQVQLGNELWETHDYRTPGASTSYKLGTSQGGAELTQLSYDFHATQNNGNVQSQTIIRGGNSWVQTYAYDTVNRLLGVSENAGAWSQSYGYDQYGNRFIGTTSGIAVLPNEPTSLNDFNSLNNRLTGINYDNAGNQTAYGNYTLAYDAESRNTAITSTSDGNGSFVYDGDGRRVKKTWTPSGGTETKTFYVYDTLGQMAVEYSDQAPTSTGTSYMFTDMLGSVRTITDQGKNIVENYDYLPFGRMLGSGVNGRGTGFPTSPDINYDSRSPQKFTGKERDAETGLDFFQARYYSGAQGRFLSVDPENYGARIGNPQSWNAYAYVSNNPLNYIDPTGMDRIDPQTLIDLGWSADEAFRFADSLPGSNYNPTLFRYEQDLSDLAKKNYEAYVKNHPSTTSSTDKVTY